jgi:hypothetical protein
LNVLLNVVKSSPFRLDLLGGFRYLELSEALHVEQDFMSADGSEQETWDDSFRTRNQFYGGQLGVRAEYTCNRFFADLTGKVALGATHQQVSITGDLTQASIVNGTDSFGNPVQNVQIAQSPSGGLLGTPGSFSRDYFTVVPEVNINLGYRFTSHLQASVGYSFLYWSSVVRPGDQVTGLPKATNFWAQGINFGLALNF